MQKDLVQSQTWMSAMRRVVKSENNLKNKIQPIIQSQFDRVANNIRNGGTGTGEATMIAYSDEMAVLIFAMYESVSGFFAKQTYKTLLDQASVGAKAAAFTKEANSFPAVWSQVLIEYLRRHGIRFVSDMTETTRNGIVEVIATMQRNGATPAQIATALETSGIPAVRARRIARTEVTRAVNAGILIAASAVPFVTRKQWITAGDERVRTEPFSHSILNGVTKELSEPFQNGENIRFPGDPAASAENVINCRCVLNIMPVFDGLGRPIRRRQPNVQSILDQITPIL